MRSRIEPLQTITYSLISFVLVCYLLKSMAFILVPIAWAAFLGISLMPLSNWFEGKRFPRGFAVFTSILFTSVVAGLLLYFFVHQMIGLLETTADVEIKLEAYLAEIQAFLSKKIGIHFDPMNASESLSGLINGNNIGSLLLSTAETFILLSIIPVYIFFLLYYKDFFSEFLNRSTLKEANKRIQMVKEIAHMIQSYLSGIFIVTIIVAFMVGIAFYLLGVEYFLFFALFVAVFNLIPYIGVFLSSLVSVIYVFLTTDTIGYPILTLILLWVIQLIENNLITPVVVGNKIQLNPLAVIVAIMMGGWIWGLSGIVLFIPLVGVLKIIFDRIPSLSHYGYLLGTAIPIVETKENVLKVLGRKLAKRRHTNEP